MKDRGYYLYWVGVALSYGMTLPQVSGEGNLAEGFACLIYGLSSWVGVGIQIMDVLVRIADAL